MAHPWRWLLISAAVLMSAPAPPVADAAAASLPPFRYAVATVTAADLSASYRPGCPVTPAGLRRLTVYFYGFDGTWHRGHLVVQRAQVGNMVTVFRALYRARFPIRRMEPVERYGGSDSRSMAANNTSAFNCRAVTGGSTFSAHSYGNAVDINPVQNPYVRGSTVLPSAGRSYLDRSDRRPGMVNANGVVVRTFATAGWKWGGSWTSPQDYQHFSATGR